MRCLLLALLLTPTPVLAQPSDYPPKFEDAREEIYKTVDGIEYRAIDLYHRFSSGLHYPRTVMFATDLDNDDHQLSLRISSQHHPKSLGHAVRIMQFAAN